MILILRSFRFNTHIIIIQIKVWNTILKQYLNTICFDTCNLKYGCKLIIFDTCYLLIAICYLLPVTEHLLLSIWYLLALANWLFLYDTGYLKLAINCKTIVSFRSCTETRSCLHCHPLFYVKVLYVICTVAYTILKNHSY